MDDGSVGGQSRSHGQGKTGRMAKATDAQVDLKLALHTLGLAIEKLTALSAQLGRNEMQALRTELESDLGLTARTLEGVSRRLR